MSPTDSALKVGRGIDRDEVFVAATAAAFRCRIGARQSVLALAFGEFAASEYQLPAQCPL